MRFISSLLVFLFSLITFAQIKVSDNHRYLATKDGQPFFWLGDTDWEIFHRLTREEAEEFLEIRRQQGFNVIQAVALAEFEGIRQPNRYGDFPLINADPTKLAITTGSNPTNTDEYDYWDNVDFVINKAAEKGLYIGLLPTWGDKVADLWGDGPRIFNPENAKAYATTLAKRYGKQWNVVWILGGDRPAVYQGNDKAIHDDRPVWEAMAQGIQEVLGKDVFITYHPSGGNSSSKFVHLRDWLDMNAFQSGHGARETDVWNWVTHDLSLKPLKPTLDMEPCYEDHPVNPWDGKWTRQRGYFTAYDVRARIYRGVFAGTCGVTYGHHQIWQFLNKDLYAPINPGDTIIGWQKAAKAEGAYQMQYLKNLMLSRPYFTRIPDQSLITSDKGSTYVDLVQATRDEQGTYALIYLPQSKPVTIDLSKITGKSKNIWWFDPRTGKATKSGSIKDTASQTFTPPPNGTDWILVIDDASKKFKAPGLIN
ncbi:glycoside hydrolase family 140 protein [Cytophagaceae bacterium YF14B1]|uniref:Glycoside hydrolase family 140 protein n=1 Tax=Xanthocytophaga flava TaxID=3048013 RepID=A0AAE3QXK3_9BACT|nr:glycoside hydrolase family 140 protein [Xanthocytophaga flavus]MDJ1484599.1 glycoside hydrolase family 140 protein [Xanthocytophaga flavus]